MTKSKEEVNPECSIRRFSPPEPGMEVVISGIAGRFPASKTVRHLQENLFNKVDLVTKTDERWDLDHPDIPNRTGKIHDLSKFDALFFGVHFKQAHAMDPMCRMLLEHTYEAIVDAGVHPRQLRGSNTGVFIGACFSESEKTWFYEKLQVNGFGITGCSRAMLANRISYWLGVHGPSYAVDSACSSSLFALEHAYEAIRSGKCDSAIVGGANLCLHPHVSLQFSRLGVLSPDGCCRSFDANANGYARSETVGVMFLQRSKDAKRIYATVVHGKTNSDGFKEQGITFPSSVIQSALLQDFYVECGFDPNKVDFMECHGTGTRVGDPEEINAVEKVFCQNRKGPLRIGSIKSNLGHSEPASGFCSISKVLIAMETGILPPNLHFKTPREGVKALENGTIQVVSEPTPWEGGHVGINSFGFGGANAHILLKHNPKKKVDNGAPKDDLPRLVLVSARTEEGVQSLLNDVESRPVDVEYVRLLHDVHSDNISGHLYRGYSIIGRQISDEPIRETENYPGSKKPIWFVFSGMGSQWPAMGAALMRFPVFAKSIQRCAAALSPKGVDIIDIITTKDKKVFDNIVNSFVGIAAIQIGLVDLLYALGIVPDNIIGHSVGELGCAYADGCFTAEQMVLSAYSRGMASIESEVIFGSMAAVGLGYHDLKDIVPHDVDIACHNSETSATISGPAESVAAFVAKLQAKNIFAKEVACSNIPYHSRYIAPAGSKLLTYLKQVIPKPNPRSQKWISTSVPQAEWSTAAAKLSSAEYHTNSLLNSVLFEEALKHIPSDAVTIEIAPHGLLQAILRRALDPTVVNIALTKRNHTDNAEVFLQALGKLYNTGYHPQLSNIYPEVSFPVSRGTPMISPLIKWEHSDDWYVTKFKPHEKISSGERTVDVTMTDEFFELMSGHVIDGRNLLPATGYLHIVWETLGMMTGEFYTQLPVVFEDIVFHRATTIPKEGNLQLVVMIQKGSGRFEIVDGTTLVVSGYVRTTQNLAEEKINKPPIVDEEDEPLTTKDIYKELRLRGYQYAGIYRGLKRASIDATKGLIAWNSNFVSFMDNMLQLHILGFDTRSLLVPTSIRKIVIDVREHVHILRTQETEEKHIPVRRYKDLDVIVAGGIEVCGLSAAIISRRKPAGDPVLEKYNFVAHKDRRDVSLQEAVRLCVHVALENQPMIKVKTVELFDASSKVTSEDLVSPIIQTVLGDLPLIQADISLGIDPECLEEDALNTNIHVVEPKKLANDGTALIAVGYGLLLKTKSDLLKQLLSAVKNGGFLIIRDIVSNNPNASYLEKHDLQVILEKCVGKELIILAKKKEKLARETVVVRVNNNEFEWIEHIQKVLKQEAESEGQRSVRLIVVGEQDPESGVLGLVNCLRKEPGGEIIRGVFVQDTNAPPFSLDNPLYRNQLQLDLAINVLNEGNVWGSYRHLLLPELVNQHVHHAVLQQLVRGDISSLRWLQGPLRPDFKDDSLVYITHSSINFRDVMLTTGKLNYQANELSRKDIDSAIGLEYCGYTASGQRVMGISLRGFSNLCVTDSYLRWPIPDEWTMEDAATVPIVYATCFFALHLCGRMQKGDKVLIHAGSGGVGQAAINLALHDGCEIFTTVGTPEKRKFIKETFPSIPDDHIGNSRDTSFEEMIKTVTKGEGVDIVLNSLAEEKLQASVRCLAREGRFLEIGKFDLVSNNKLGMQCFLKEVSFQGVMLDYQIFKPIGKKNYLSDVFTKGLASGAVKPLARTVFPKEKLEDAFRYMAAGKHIGKVILKVREDNEPLNTPIMALPRFHCNENKTYVILGGLGGFGMELADWLVIHNAKKIVLTSRTGIKNGYQRMRIQLWQSYGVKILIISGQDASVRSECEFILKAAEDLGPVDAIFNLAVVLKDSIFTNQTVDAFKESFRSKAWATRTLDEVSRKLCHNLTRFVVFSSVSCGRGNAGQTNYGMANSIMERICEKRVQDGLPGLAIQWGAVGDVGLVADMQDDDKELIIGGTLQQKIRSCLSELDGFLMQDEPVVASMVVAEKRAGGMGANNIVEAVLNIMGLKDIKLVSHHTSLAELGMDSMMAVEIKQTLEREFEVLLSAQDIRSLNFSKLIALAADDDKQNKKKKSRNVNEMDNVGGIKLIVHVLDVDISNFEVCLQLNTSPIEGKSEVFLIPGIEGFGSIFNKLAPSIKCPAVCLQMGVHKEHNSSIETMANYLLPHVIHRLSNRRSFTIVAYSFGSLIGIELVRLLEAQGMTGRLVLIDGAPVQMKALWDQHVPSSSEAELEDNVLLGVMDILNPEKTADLVMALSKLTCWEEKLDAISSLIPAGRLTESLGTQRDLYTSIVERFKALQKYNISALRPIRTAITLLKPTLPSVRNIDEEYGLRKVTDSRIEIHYVEGNHYSMLTDYKVAAAINDEPLEDADEFKSSIMEEGEFVSRIVSEKPKRH